MKKTSLEQMTNKDYWNNISVFQERREHPCRILLWVGKKFVLETKDFVCIRCPIPTICLVRCRQKHVTKSCPPIGVIVFCLLPHLSDYYCLAITFTTSIFFWITAKTTFGSLRNQHETCIRWHAIAEPIKSIRNGSNAI